MSDKPFHDIVLHGKWSAFEDRGDWRQFEIIVEGKQYPYKLSTSKTEVIEQMMALRDVEGCTFYGAEQESDKINERSGKPYMNRYINEARPGLLGDQIFPGSGGSSGASAGASGSGSQGSTSTAGGSGSSTYYQNDLSPEAVARIEDGQRRDIRSRAWAHTISALQHTFLSDVVDDAHFARLQAFQRKIYGDICGAWGLAPADSPYMPAALRAEPASPESQPRADASAEPPPDDSDIPF